MSNYWTKISRNRISRRRGLGIGAGAAAAAFLAACGGDDSDSGSTGTSVPGTTGTSTGAGSTGGTGTSSLITQSVNTSAEAQRGGTLNWFTLRESPSLDIAGANLANNDKILLVYNVLLQVKPGELKASERDVIGDLCESWEWSPDLLTLTLKMRPGVKWHNKPPVNGREWDTEDVNFSWDRVKSVSGDRHQISNEVNADAPILSLTTPDDSTIVVKLAYPQSYLLGILARNFGAKLNMVPKETDTTFDIRRDMIGTGAYMLSAFEPSVSYEYKVNPDYYEPDHHFIDTIRQPIISEYASGLAQFKAGNIDTWAVNPEDILNLKTENPEIDLYQGPFATINLNTAFSYLPGSPFHDERVRQAYSMSIDRDLWIEVFYNVSNFEGAGLPVDTRWNSALQCTEEGWWIDPKTDAIGEGGQYFQRNIEEAKKLLAAAGYPDGLDFPVTIPTGSSAYGTEFVSQAEVLDQMMREAGLRGQTRTIDYTAEFVPQYRDAVGQFEGIMYKVGTTIADDAVASLGSRFATSAGTQFYGFDANGTGDQSGDPEVDSMIARAVAEIDMDARKDIVRQLEQYLAKKQYLVRWPGGATGFEMARSRLKNYLVYRGSAAGTTVGSKLSPYFWWLDQA